MRKPALVARLLSPLGALTDRLSGQAGRLLTGTALGQAAVLATTPLVTRLYTPAELGGFMVLFSFVGVVGFALSWRLELALVAERDETRARNLLALCLTLVPLMALAAGLGAYSLAQLHWLSTPVLPARSAVLIALLLTVTGTFTVLRYWQVRRAGFATIARGLIGQGLARAIAPLVFAFWQASALALALSEITGRLAGLRIVGRGAWSAARDGARPALWRGLVRENWKFPVLLVPSAVLDALAQNIAVPLLAYTFGPVHAGEYGLALRVGGTAVTLLAASLGDVLHSRFAAATVAERQAILARETRRLAKLSVLIFVPVAVLAPLLTVPVFGRAWAGTGWMLAMSTPAFMAMLVVGPLSRILLVTQRIELKLIADVSCVALPALALLAAAPWGLPYALGAFVLATLVAYGIYYAMVARAARSL